MAPEVSFGPPPPIALPEDGRWLIFLNLDLEALDESLHDALLLWAEKFAELAGTKADLTTYKANLEGIENALHVELAGQAVGNTKGEREAHLKALVRSNSEWGATNTEVRILNVQAVRLEGEVALVHKRMGVLQSRIAWRARTIGLLAAMPKTPMEALPVVEVASPEMHIDPGTDDSTGHTPPWVSL